MARRRPRRALRPLLRERIARVAIPATVAGAVLAGVALTMWSPAGAVSATPAAAGSPTAATQPRTGAASAERAERASRNRAGLRPPVAAGQRAAVDPAQAARPTPPQAKPRSAPAKPRPKPVVTGIRYATAALKVRRTPDADAAVLSTVPAGRKLSITATVTDGYRQVIFAGQPRWVKAAYLARKKPALDSGGLSSAPCQSGSAVENGLQPNTIRVHRAICARFPQVSAYGGVRADALPEHPSGRALDAMISNPDTGWQIAKFVRANASALGVTEVIYAQQIWTTQRGGEGWRSMPDRGSASANHFDHVHVTVR